MVGGRGKKARAIKISLLERGRLISDRPGSRRNNGFAERRRRRRLRCGLPKKIQILIGFCFYN